MAFMHFVIHGSCHVARCLTFCMVLRPLLIDSPPTTSPPLRRLWRTLQSMDNHKDSGCLGHDCRVCRGFEASEAPFSGCRRFTSRKCQGSHLLQSSLWSLFCRSQKVPRITRMLGVLVTIRKVSLLIDVADLKNGNSHRVGACPPMHRHPTHKGTENHQHQRL